MVRDDLYITIPTLFRCPISLDVMKSPVSLCTGVTYDRVSIQRWLDSGNNTCPATMQVLKTKDFVPNRTLQRLIQIWADWANERSDDTAKSPVPKQEHVPELIRDLKIKSDNCLDSLAKIVCFASESAEGRKFLAKIDGFVGLMVDFLSNVEEGKSNRLHFVEQVIKILNAVAIDSKDFELLSILILKNNRDCLSSMLLVLQKGTLESRISTAKLLETMAIDAESKLLIAQKDGVLSELLKLILPDTDVRLIEASLSCLIAISEQRRIKLKLVYLGAIRSLSKLLIESNLTVSIIEKVLKLLEMASATKEARSQICEDSTCIQGILQRILKVSTKATEHAVTTLWSVCYLFRDQKAQEAVMSSNGLTKLLLLMQSNCSPVVRQMSGDLLKIFTISSKSCLSSYHTKSTHIMPF